MWPGLIGMIVILLFGVLLISLFVDSPEDTERKRLENERQKLEIEKLRAEIDRLSSPTDSPS